MFGSVSQWMMNWLGGIQPAKSAIGFDKIVIRPQTVAGLDWVKSSYLSIRGKIVSNWSRRGDELTFDIEIPVNTEARVTLPASRFDQVSENGKPLSRARGVTSAMKIGKWVECNLGSGQYKFVVAS